MAHGGYIALKRALKDYLREREVTLQDLLDLMDEEKEGIIEALKKRIILTEAQGRELERKLTNRELNLLLFVVQAFYILNTSGTYKGRVIQPTRREVVSGGKVTPQGCRMILRALGTHTDWPYVYKAPRED